MGKPKIKKSRTSGAWVLSLSGKFQMGSPISKHPTWESALWYLRFYQQTGSTPW